ncbi:MAG: acylneuraminate cytidylyltransferase family protein [Sulfuricella sp.]|jgi:N-acylneuraminate cytidylyltransferase/CMP-N,N'-diacetyllegionaminic acid synthase
MISSRVLAIIPARGGSKGIPRKNLVDICGKPLIAWSIATGLRLVERGVVVRSIVTTDDAEIADVSRRWGGDVPFLRPGNLATDQAKSIGYILHALDWFIEKGETFDAVLLLQPTSPQRDVDTIAPAIVRFLEQNDAQSLISCYQEEYINDLVMYEDDGTGYLKPKNPLHNKGVRRQEHGPVMVRNGALYITKVPYLRLTGQLVCDRPMLMKMSKIDSIDLDTPDDINLLRAVLCR